MFEYLKGQLIETTENTAILDINGIGYKIFIPIHLFGKLCVNKEIMFFVSLVIREDAHTLFGFQDKQERDLFETLLNVSGIGPKSALNLIGHLPLPLFSQAIITNHVPTLTKVPGIGKKTAERLLLELKGKTIFTGISASSPLQKINDALSALLQLGVSPSSARSSLDKVLKENPEADVSTLISLALKAKSGKPS